MNKSKNRSNLLLALTLACGAASVAWAQPASLEPGALKALPAFANGVEAYIYGYPLVMMGITERVSTYAATAVPGTTRSPLNQFVLGTTLPNGSYRDVVLPSTSTLYAASFLNLAAEPIVLHLPPIDRFYLMELLDAWTNVTTQSPGTRQGSQPGDYVLAGPDWNGTVPAGANLIRMDTNTMWIIGRIFTSGTDADLSHVANDIMPYLSLKPLSQIDNINYAPPANLPLDPSVEAKTTPLHQVANMDACAFFGTMAAMMKTNLPLAQDKAIVKQLAKIGLVPGDPFDCTTLDNTTKAALQLAVVSTRTALANSTGGVPPTPTNWSVSLNVGDYGRQYLLRAVVAEKALGANLPQDAVYGYATQDNKGKPLKGTNRYVVHFAAPTAQQGPGELPPVVVQGSSQGFWSLTIYNADGTLVDTPGVTWNAIGVGPLGATIQNHTACFNSNGSLDIYLQTDPPQAGTPYCNWIPIPPSGGATPSDPDFIAFLRVYWPGQSVLSGKWYPPAVTKPN